MKKIYAFGLSLTFSFLSLTSNAAQHIVGVGVNNTNTFTPPFFTASVGDTVSWVLVTGTHTVVSTNVPVGAASFSSPSLSTLGDMFMYTITTAGTYDYFCSIHGVMMSGSFTASVSTGLGDISPGSCSVVYPNPFTDKITIVSNGSYIEILNLLGEKVTSFTTINAQPGFEINLSSLRAGIYFCCNYKEGKLVETRKIIKVK
jgi:plastocyanin